MNCDISYGILTPTPNGSAKWLFMLSRSTACIKIAPFSYMCATLDSGVKFPMALDRAYGQQTVVMMALSMH